MGRRAGHAAPSKTAATVGLVCGAVVVVGAIVLADARWSRLPDAPAALAGYAELMARGVLRNPFDEPQSEYWRTAAERMLESLAMAWIGTLIGALLSFPLGLLAARNVSPGPAVFATRLLLNVIRAIPELILAIAIMLPIFGLGPLAGALALGVGSIGTLGKLTSEVVEVVDPGPLEAVRAVGAGQVEILRWGVVPQVLPEIVSLWLYRFEINIRASAVLGVVGAGGIGQTLADVFRVREWDRVGLTLLVIVLVTIAVDQLSARVRHRLVAGTGAGRAPADAP
jgi:phosphonate transport system permease protein